MNIMQIGDKNPNYLGSYDLYDLPKPEINVTIQRIATEKIVSSRGEENATVCYFAEEYKPLILNVTNKKRLSRLFKTNDTEKMCGKYITVGVEKVKAFGKISDALRIKETLPVRKQVAEQKCADCGAVIQGIGNLNSEQMAQYTLKKFGRGLCAQCATKESKKGTVNNENNENQD